MEIINYLHELARQHKRIKGFMYGKPNAKGAGNDVYPLVWLDDPILGRSLNPGVLQYTTNIDFLGIPENDAQVAAVQSEAFVVGLSFAERIKQTRNDTGVSIERFSFVTLRDYYDDMAAGYRFTFLLNQANPTDRCAEDFDLEKEIKRPSAYPDFMADNPSGCTVFSGTKGLPNFKT